MAPEPTLFDTADEEEDHQNGVLTHRDKWLAFHRANPEVYTGLVSLARRMHERGLKHYGMKSLFEVMRFHRAMKATDEPFKLNNNYTAFYARLIMLRCPDLDGFFEVRIQKSATKQARDGDVQEDADWREDPFWTSMMP